MWTSLGHPFNPPPPLPASNLSVTYKSTKQQTIKESWKRLCLPAPHCPTSPPCHFKLEAFARPLNTVLPGLQALKWLGGDFFFVHCCLERGQVQVGVHCPWGELEWAFPEHLVHLSQTTFRHETSRGFLSWQECESDFQPSAKVEQIKPACRLVECEGN